MITAAVEFGNWYLFSDIKGIYLTLFRITVFVFPLYLLLSRFYGYLGNIPTRYFKSKYSGTRLSTLTLVTPNQVPFSLLYGVAILSCVTGLLGVVPAISALVASFSIIMLNNYYSTITTSDLEVLPYVVGMWPFVILPPDLTVPLWADLGSGVAPPAPAYPFRLLQIYLCAIFFISGLTKVPFWKEWVFEKGVYHDSRNWNTISPYLDTHWSTAEKTRDVPYLWETIGFLTIIIELGAAIPLLYPPAIVLFWPGVLGLFLGNHLLRSTSFILFPWLYLVSFLPWIAGVIN